MAAIGVVGGDPTKLDKHTVLTEPGVGLYIECQDPNATAIQVDSLNSQAADTMVFNWENNMAQMIRTGYHNEKGELRARPGSPSTNPLRVQQRSNLQSADLTQWTDSGNTVFSRIDAAGYADLRVDTWVGLTLPSGMSAGSSAPEVRIESAYGVVRMRGWIVTDSGTGFTAGNTLATIPVGFRPVTQIVVPGRQAEAGVTMTINTNGTITSGTTMGTGGGITFRLDNITWEVAT